MGDKPEDTEAARAAGVVAIGAGWGTEDLGALIASKPEQLFLTVLELRNFLLPKA